MGFFTYKNESKLSTKQRDKMDDEIFGIPQERKYPLNDKSHVLSAMRYFDKCDPKYKKELANNIVKRAKELNIGINTDSDYYKYIKEDIQEITNMIIQESAADKQYTCPYCEYRGTKVDLVTHVEDEHEELIPKDYTAARVVYNHVNKKTSGCCRFCKGPTPWNEKTWKYRAICERKVCKEKASKLAEENLKKATGMTKSERLNNPDIQNSMLNNRKISGTYNFKGVKKTYVGSYEYRLLEFYDKVLDVSPDEIQTPGPVIEYEYKGKKHQWITDLYYITANLVHDAKDGGDNPNNRDMKEYREKQIAKENAIKKQGKYNYVRVTNNNFEQLLDVLSDIKYAMIDDSVKNKTVWKINEMMAVGSLNPVVGTGTGEYVVNYGINGTFTGRAYCNNTAMSKIYKYPGKKKSLKQIDENTIDFINSYDYELYKYIGSEEKSLQEIAEMIEEIDLQYDSRFKKCLDMYSIIELKQDSIKETLYSQFKKESGRSVISIEESFSNEYKNKGYRLMQDINGYFIEHGENRSCYFESVEDIPQEIFNII